MSLTENEIDPGFCGMMMFRTYLLKSWNKAEPSSISQVKSKKAQLYSNSLISTCGTSSSRKNPDRFHFPSMTFLFIITRSYITFHCANNWRKFAWEKYSCTYQSADTTNDRLCKVCTLQYPQ